MIWLIAGTKTARELAEELTARGHEVVATTTTAYGKELLGQNKKLTALSGKLEPADMEKLIGDYKVRLIIDASHPYSEAVKQNALKVSKRLNIPALRYERRPVAVRGAEKFSSHREAAESLEKRKGNVLLTTGSNNVHYFTEGPERLVYARVLPTEESIAQCRAAGFGIDRIIAMKFSFSAGFEKALYTELGIKYLVTKESGDEGGIREKVAAALEAGIEVILIERPESGYREVFYDRESIMARTEEILNG